MFSLFFALSPPLRTVPRRAGGVHRVHGDDVGGRDGRSANRRHAGAAGVGAAGALRACSAASACLSAAGRRRRGQVFSVGPLRNCCSGTSTARAEPTPWRVAPNTFQRRHIGQHRTSVVGCHIDRKLVCPQRHPGQVDINHSLVQQPQVEFVLGDPQRSRLRGLRIPDVYCGGELAHVPLHLRLRLRRNAFGARGTPR